jgi:hypothetical protein
VLNDLYEPQAFLDRLDDLYLRQGLRSCDGRRRWWRHWWNGLKSQAANLACATSAESGDTSERAATVAFWGEKDGAAASCL